MSLIIGLRRELMWKDRVMGVRIMIWLWVSCGTCRKCMTGGFLVIWLRWHIRKWVDHTCCSYMIDDIVQVGAHAEPVLSSYDRGWDQGSTVNTNIGGPFHQLHSPPTSTLPLPSETGLRGCYAWTNLFGFLLCFCQYSEFCFTNNVVSVEGFQRILSLE